MAKKTQFITLDPHLCVACWKCLKVCPKGVIGKVNILGIHKHAIFKHPDDCIGCGACVAKCKHGAYSKNNIEG